MLSCPFLNIYLMKKMSLVAPAQKDCYFIFFSSPISLPHISHTSGNCVSLAHKYHKSSDFREMDLRLFLLSHLLMLVLQNCLQFLLSLAAASAQTGTPLSSSIALFLGTASYSFCRAQDRTHSRESPHPAGVDSIKLHRDYLFWSPHCELLEGKEHAFRVCVPLPQLLLQMSTVIGLGSAQMSRALSLPMGLPQ